MSTQHTPGPWHWDGNPCNYDKEQEAPWLVDANNSFPPILGGTITCQSDANARLIAAAPELLKALNECRLAIQGGTTFEPYDSRGAGFQQEFGIAFVEYLNATIAKATGETK